MQDRVRSLSERLSAEPQQNPYLSRLQQRARALRIDSGFGAVEREVLAEMAAALGRSESHVTGALERLSDLGARIDALELTASTPARDAKLSEAIAEFNAVRELAKRRRWELVVHREALGFRAMDDLVERTYPIPPRR